jgi:hypothetical protein
MTRRTLAAITFPWTLLALYVGLLILSRAAGGIY